MFGNCEGKRDQEKYTVGCIRYLWHYSLFLHLKTATQVQDSDFFWSAHKSFPWWWVMLFHLSPLLGESCLCARPAPAAVGIRRDWTKGSRRSLALHHRSLSCFVSFYGSKKKNHTINDMPTRDSLYYPPSGIAMKLQNQPSTIFDWWPLKAG